MSERTLVELFHGRGAHVSPIACVEDLSADLAGRTVDGFPHSIWQLLSHMNYWMDYEIKRIDSEAPAYPQHAAGSWLPNSPPPGETQWNDAVVCFRGLVGTLTGLAESDSRILSREVQATHPQQAQHSSSVEAILWQTMAHNTYHTGQIAMLRRRLGVWTPRAGGDTW